MNAELSIEPQAGSTPAIEIRNLSRRFGRNDALSDVSLTIPRGVVFGLVGTNGAGKTTLIRHTMGLLRPQSGSVAVFGLDPVSNPTGVLSRVGYLSELNELPEWMRVDELIRFTRPFYPNWDDSYARKLQEMFELDPRKQIQQLSKGQRARVGLVLALSYRAELLILDEPSSGLDPLVRRDILRAVIETIVHEGRTVLFSSHLLDEVERVADQVAIINSGRIIQNDALDSLKSSYHRMVLHFDRPVASPPDTAGFFNWQGGDRHWTAYFHGPADEAARVTSQLDARLVDSTTPSLNEIFLALVGSKHPAPAPEALA
jgi:ABC-2 type transport system ATP-binding protein